jgi:hypothetical protein
VQAANRTTPGLFVQNLRLWGYADNKEHYSDSKVQGSKVQSYDFLYNLYYNP